MIKRRFNYYFKKGALLACLILFINCQKDNAIETDSQESRFKVTSLNYEHVISNIKVINKLNKINSNDLKSNQNKDEYNEAHDFTINTDNVKYLEDTQTNYHSYSFPISREAPQNDKMENLLLSLNQNNEYDSFIVKYDFTEEEFKNFSENDIPLLEDKFTEYIPIDLESSDSNGDDSARLYWVCVDHYSYELVPNNEGNNVGGEPLYTPEWVLQSRDCSWISSSGGNYSNNNNTSGNTGFSGNETDSGNGTSDGTNTVISSPTYIKDPPESIDPVHSLNCEELKKITSNPPPGTTNPYITGDHKSIRIAITNIDDNLGSNFEHGFGLYNRGNFPLYGPYAHHTPASEDNHVHFKTRGYQFGTLHTHPENDIRIPMFSHDDIYSLLNIKDNYTLTSLTPNGDAVFVAVLVVKQAGQTHTYAIKIDDPVKLLNINNYGVSQSNRAERRDWNKFGEKLAKKYEDNADGVNGSPNQYQKAFLKFIKDKDLGVSLYKMKPNDINDPNNQETWEKLSLSHDGTTIDNTPCNN